MRLKRKFFGLRQHYFRSQNDAKNATYLQRDYTHTTVDNNIFRHFAERHSQPSHSDQTEGSRNNSCNHQMNAQSSNVR